MIKDDEMGEACNISEEKWQTYVILVGKSERMR
jgi:hypothetical protein